MANLTLRSTTSATDPGSTSAKGSALTHTEMDSNFILLQADIDGKISAASPTLTGATTIDDELRFNDSDDSNYITVKAPATVGTNYTFTLPDSGGTNGHVLTTDGSGTLTWTAKTVDTTNLVDDTTPQLGGDLDVNGNDIVSVSNGDINIEPNGTGVTNMKNIRMGSGAGGIVLDSPTFGDMLRANRQSTSHYNYSLEISSDSQGTARAAGQPGGAFGFTHKATGVGDFYVGSINGVVGDEGTPLSAGENNNGIRLYTYSDNVGYALNTVAEFRYATSEFMKGALTFDYTSNKVTIEAPTTDDDIEIKTNGTGKVNLTTNNTQIGKSNTTAVLTTNGTGDLSLTTNDSTNSGEIRIYNGANNNITLSPNGTGELDITSNIKQSGGKIIEQYGGQTGLIIHDQSEGGYTTSSFSTPLGMLAGPGIQIDSAGQFDYPAVVLRNNSISGYPNIWAAKARPSGGTDYSTDAYMEDGETIFRFYGAPYKDDATAGEEYFTAGASGDFKASEDHSDGNLGCKIEFGTINNGTTTNTTKLTIDDNIECSAGLVLQHLSSDPTGTNGMMYYNTTSNKFRGYANGAWTDLH